MINHKFQKKGERQKDTKWFINAEANSNPCLFGPGPQPLTTVIVRAALGLALGMSSTAYEDLSGFTKYCC